MWEGSCFGGARCPGAPLLVALKEVHCTYPLEAGQLSCENSRKKCENACCVVEVVSSQFDLVHIVSEVLCSI